MKTLTVEKGQVLDKLVRDYYGTAAGTMEAVLAANPDLPRMGPVFDRRRTITMPDLSPSDVGRTPTRLWD